MASGTDAKLRDGIIRLTGVDPDADVKLPAVANPDAIHAKDSLRKPNKDNAAPASGSGIASPLVETAYADREFYTQPWKTSDGLFSMNVVKVIRLTDANGKPVEIQIKPPSGVTG